MRALFHCKIIRADRSGRIQQMKWSVQWQTPAVGFSQ